MNKTSKIYIAGHSGLIGSSILRHLLKLGYNNLIFETRKKLDLSNEKKLYKFLNQHQPEYIFLAAGMVGGIIKNKDNPFNFLKINLLIQNNIFNWCHDNSTIKKVIFFGSSCMYPKICKQPMSEDLLLTGKPENTSIAYAIAKITGVETCHALNNQENNKRFIPVIPNSTYGENDNFDPESGHVLSSLIHKFHQAKINNLPEVVLWGTGKPKREFIFSDDLASACIFLMKRNIAHIDFPINIGTGSDTSIKNLAKEIKEIIKYNGKIIWDKTKPDGSIRKLLDSKKINELGWKSKVSLIKGIKKTYEIYRKK